MSLTFFFLLASCLSFSSPAEEQNPTIEWVPLKSGCVQCFHKEFQKKRRRSKGFSEGERKEGIKEGGSLS